MHSRRTFLTAAAAAVISVSSMNTFAGKDLEGIEFWDNHAGFGYVGPQDVNLLDHWRSAGVNYLSVNVAYDAVPWSSTIHAIAEDTRGIEARQDMVLCSTFARVLEAWRAGKLALMFDIEGDLAHGGTSEIRQSPIVVVAETLVAHIAYVANLVGVDHVGIGLDYDPTSGPVLDESIASRYWPERQYPASVKTDCLAPSVLPEVCRQLRSRGYKESAIRAIMSGTFRRVASTVWAT
jgi:hypothetical protein